MSSPTKPAAERKNPLTDFEQPEARQFADRERRSWELRLDFDRLDEIRAQFDIDLGDVQQFTKTWARLLWDDQLALRVIWHLVSDQADELSEKDWRKTLDGKILERALDALLAAVFFFTPPARLELLRKATARMIELYREAIDEGEKAVEMEFEDMIDRYQQSQKPPGSTRSRSRGSSATSGRAGRSAKPTRR